MFKLPFALLIESASLTEAYSSFITQGPVETRRRWTTHSHGSMPASHYKKTHRGKRAKWVNTQKFMQGRAAELRLQRLAEGNAIMNAAAKARQERRLGLP